MINENTFDIKNFDDGDVIIDSGKDVDEDDINIVYLKKDEIQKIKIINKNIMICDDQEYSIKDYLQQINDFINKIKDTNKDSNELFDDLLYEICGDCKNNMNKYFCEYCQINICEICKEKHERENRIINLDEMKMKEVNNITTIKKILDKHIIHINDEIEINNNDEKNKIYENISDNIADILLIIKIISINFNNYFHYKNIEGILDYCLTIDASDSFINYEGKGATIYDNGYYYIGQFKNNLRNGEGILYNKNGNIKYDGEWANGEMEGNGKYYYENGAYYIGQFKNNLRNGKGILYYKNGNIFYDGEWFNNKIEGNGKYYYENGNYYIGQFKNKLPNGKGILYYKNGNVLYEGEWFNNKIEGNGKLYSINGNYYIGQFKNNLKNGKGKLCYKNGNILYEGEFFNDKVEGNGKFYYEDEKYYIGKFKNNLSNG